MRIIKLTMNAFSTYHQKTVIDFEQMIDHGIYLICGATGAGKTTIFDAISFALYGQASGSERKTNHLRSDFASPQEETYVELVFELHQSIYTVRRTPKYNRPGYKTEKSASATFMYGDNIIDGIKEVDAKINELLGVDVHQFKQIVMIAQGEFTKLIYASSQEREKVLRHLFHTESLVMFEDMLREKTKVLKDDYLFSQKELSSQYQMLQLPQEFMSNHKDFHQDYIQDGYFENKQIKNQYQEVKDNYHKQKEFFEQQSQRYFQLQKYNEGIQVYQRIKKDYKNLLQQKEHQDVLKQDIEKMKHIQNNQQLIIQYQKTSQQLQDTKKKYEHVCQKHEQYLINYQKQKEAYEKLPIHKQTKEKLLLEIHEYRDLLQKQQQYFEAKKKYDQTSQEIDNIKQRYQELFETNARFEDRMERDQDNVNYIPTLQLQLDQMEQLMKESNERRVSIHELSDLYDQIKDIQDKHYELSQIYTKTHKKYISLQHQYQQEDERFKHQQAGLLALNLRDNEPCPVCGSLHHPHPAVLSQDILSAQELETMFQEIEKRKVEDENAYQDVLLQQTLIETTKAKLSLLKEQLHIEDQLSKEVFIYLLSDITQITKKQKKNYQKQQVELEYLYKIKKSLQKDQIVLNNNKKQLESFQIIQHDLEKKLTKYQNDLEHLSFIDCECQYQDVLKTKEKEFKEIESKIDDIEKQYHQCEKELSSLKQTKLDLNENMLVLKQEMNDYQNQMNGFVKEVFGSYEVYEKYISMMKDFDVLSKQYQDYQLQSQSLKSQLELYKEYENQEIKDLSEEEVSLKKLEDLKDQLFNQMNELNYKYQNNESLLKTIEQKYLKNQKVFDEYTLYQDLYDYTSGKNPQKISFERYVLSAYFEHILEYANIELWKMSQGRYMLYRKQDAKGSKQQGLDLVVLDYETGMMRDIQSLSGGESFKAALSLALGLSSMIQTYAGGIESNTLFIDEGFGSLDNESLDQALNVLLDLKNDQKVIGIISHVSELKEKIHTQIIVEKSHDGSLLHIEKD